MPFHVNLRFNENFGIFKINVIVFSLANYYSIIIQNAISSYVTISKLEKNLVLVHFSPYIFSNHLHKQFWPSMNVSRKFSKSIGFHLTITTQGSNNNCHLGSDYKLTWQTDRQTDDRFTVRSVVGLGPYCRGVF